MKTNPLSGKMEKAIGTVFRIVLGVVFLYASVDKIIHPDNFARDIQNWQLLPEVLVNLSAVLLPWVEFLCGLLLLSGQWVRSSSLLLAGLLFIFIVAVSINLGRGLDHHCGCFNTGAGRKIGLTLLGGDLALLAIARFLVFKGRDDTGWRAFLGKGPA